MDIGHGPSAKGGHRCQRVTSDVEGERRNMEDRTEPDNTTRSVEEEEAGRAHEADRPPTESEERDAERYLQESDEEERKSVAEHYEEMTEIGAEAKGEGRVE